MEKRRPAELSIPVKAKADGAFAAPPSPPLSPFTSRNSLTPWAHVSIEFGSCSLFDAKAPTVDDLPFELPAGKYLEETLAGMHGAPHSTTAASKNWQILQAVVQGNATKQACSDLAWVAIGTIFGTIDLHVVEGLQKRLATSWFELTLDVGRLSKGNKKSKDWAIEALPAVFVQAIYRMLVDGFPPESRAFVQSGQDILLKLSQVARHEVTGFQENEQTFHKLRKRLFCSEVLEVPHLNQRESMEHERRREHQRKESAQQKVEQPPLAFGGSESELTEDQLEHILAQRCSRKNDIGFTRGSLESFPPSSMEITGWTSSGVRANFTTAAVQTLNDLKDRAESELSVDRYEEYSMEAEEIIVKQLSELYAEGGWIPGNTPPELAAKPVNANALLSSLTSFADKSPKTPHEPLQEASKTMRNSKKAVTMGARSVRASCDGTVAARRERERREAEQAERRRRDELLQKRIEETLPEEFNRRSLDTSLVSPALDRIAPSEGDRQLLPSMPAMKQQVKMAPPSSQFLPAIDQNASRSDLPDKGKKLAKKAMASSLRKGSDDMRKGSKEKSSSQLKDSSLSSSLPRIPRFATNGVVVSMESQNLKPEAVTARLQQHMDAFRAGSFEQTKKDNDVLTGLKRSRLDPAALHREESQFITKLESLVGSKSTPALRHMNPFTPDAKRNSLEQRPAGALGHSASAALASGSGAGKAADTKASPSSPQVKKVWNELTVVNVLGRSP
eukprot:gb/GFBE01038937.1/.p1 GENE.gb/GFBE01038937.1/~~gb/GFBE01038937.1/.p1  ORF type:complete len:733 (+),score=171.46 gb/GFBE01038937.1/:1-2199(+)